ncbi:MAG: HD domain-containing protein [Spirochaetota bacterium]|nr:HD domain-containing protein [Spirochaetota bacterium]
MNNEKDRLNEIIRLGTELNSIQDMDMLLERILLEARTVTNADAGSIYIRNGKYLIFKYSQNETKQKQLPFGKKLPYTNFKILINAESIAGYVATTGNILNIPDVNAISDNEPYSFDCTYDEKSDYNTQSMLTVPMMTNRGDIIGVLQIINAKDSEDNVVSFSRDDEPFVLHFANTASIVLQRTQMTRALLHRMIRMAELRDPKETGPHINRVATYAVELYERWAMYKCVPKCEIDKNRDILRMAAMLHDVGKVAISDLILKKPTRLTTEEYEVMKTHTYMGARLLGDKQSDFDEIAAVVSLTHHENWDGTGYPGYIDVNTGEVLERDGKGRPLPLKGEEIPIYGRVVALADVYDALSSKRVYKDAWEEEDVIKEIKSLSGKKFDPDLVSVFLDCLYLLKSIRQRYPDND